MSPRPIIEFDVETSGFQWYAHELGLVQFHSPELLGPEPIVLRHPDERERIQAILDMDADFRGWNTKYDLHFLEAAGYRLPSPDRWHDGMVEAHLLDEESPKGLEKRYAQVFGREEGKELKAELRGWLREENKRRRKVSKDTGAEFVPATYLDVPDEILVPYAATDVVMTRALGDVQDAALALTPELEELYAIEMEVMAALYEAESHGLPIDVPALERLELALAAELEELEEEAKALAGQRNFNPRSSQQLYAALKRLGADLSYVTGKSMDAENLATVDHPLARTVERHRAATKLLGTYVGPMLHGQWTTIDGIPVYKHPFVQDGRLHASIRQVGARTGRMSSADPNIQNLPRDDLRVRYAVHAEPGHKLVTVDLDSIEMRLFAAYVGEGRMLDMVRDPEADPHTATAEFVGLDDRVRAGGAIESKRDRGKRFNYAVIYGLGVNGIRKKFYVSQDEARQMRKRYHDAYPEVGAFQRRIEYALYQRGYVKTAYGRRQRVAPRMAYKAVNYLIQGTAADMLKISIAKLHRQGVPIIAAVHDELVAHVPEKDAPEVARLIEEALIDHPKIAEIVSLGAEAKIVDRWSDAKKPGYVPEHELELNYRKEAA